MPDIYASNFFLKNDTYIKHFNKQECIPVGCVPSATVAVCQGGLPQCMLEYHPLVADPPCGQTPVKT